jgi:hypothetical protein
LNQQKLTYILTDCGIIWNQFTTGVMVYEGWYFVAVPSLNTPGGMHEVLIHYSIDDGLTVLDPSPHRKYNSDGSNLKSWSDLTPFWPGGNLPSKNSAEKV